MKYVLAVSGGVDSTVLLDLAARREILREANWPRDFVVAHFDHGLRGAAARADAEFVRQLAARYGVEFILGEGNLPPNASEETARDKRYEFLRSVARRRGADIVTAHHRDDLLETIVMNLIRGTSWRGLCPMRADVVRPLLGWSKFDIVNYALAHDLAWREDATNFSPKFFRNRVRAFLARISENDKRRLLELSERQKTLRAKIEKEISRICRAEFNLEFTSRNPVSLSRYFLIMIDEKSAAEILRFATRGELTRPQLGQVWLFAKTARAGKKLEFKNIKISATRREIVIKISGK